MLRNEMEMGWAEIGSVERNWVECKWDWEGVYLVHVLMFALFVFFAKFVGMLCCTCVLRSGSRRIMHAGETFEVMLWLLILVYVDVDAVAGDDADDSYYYGTTFAQI